MNFKTRELVTIAVFGALWGVVEISLGSLLKALNVPLGGAFLAAAGLTIALIGRRFVPRRGATLFVGVIAMILKLFSIGSVVVGPMIGIFAEALIAELILSFWGRPRRTAFVVAGALGVCWTMLQPFVTGALLFGRDLFVVWLDLVDSGSRLLGLGGDTAFWVLLALLSIHTLLGAAAGWLAWQAGQQLWERNQMAGLPDSV